jgi:hypothetical protein
MAVAAADQPPRQGRRRQRDSQLPAPLSRPGCLVVRRSPSRRECWQDSGDRPRTSRGVAPVGQYRGRTPGRIRIHVAPGAVPHTRLVSGDRGRKRLRCATQPTHRRVAHALHAPAHRRPRQLRRYEPGGPTGRGATDGCLGAAACQAGCETALTSDSPRCAANVRRPAGVSSSRSPGARPDR